MKMNHICFYRGYEILQAGKIYVCPKLEAWCATELGMVRIIDREVTK